MTKLKDTLATALDISSVRMAQALRVESYYGRGEMTNAIRLVVGHSEVMLRYETKEDRDEDYSLITEGDILARKLYGDRERSGGNESHGGV